MSTALQPQIVSKVQAALQGDVVIGAQVLAQKLDGMDPEKMDELDRATLVDVGTALGAAIRKLETERRAILGPLEDWIEKTINEPFRRMVQPLKDAKERAGTLYREHQRVLEARAEEERAAAQRAANAATASGRLPATAPPAEEIAETPKNTTTGAFGKASGSKKLMVKVKDVRLVAEHYPHLLLLDNAKALVEVRAALARDKDAVLPGLEHWWGEGATRFGAR